MTILHLWNSTGWRGGENQFRLMIDYLPEQLRGVMAAPAKSELGRRLAPAIPFLSASCSGFLDIASFFAVRRFVQQHGISLMHAHTGRSHEVGALVRKLTGVPLLVSKRNDFPISGGWKYRQADRYIAVSQAAARQLERGGVASDRIEIIADSVDLRRHAQAVPDRLDTARGAPFVVCVASFAREKDHVTLLKAWSLVEAARPDARLALVGDGLLSHAMATLSSELGHRNVRFTGWREDVLDLVYGADIFVITSKSEGLCSSICDAQQASRPVVATRAGGIPEVVRDRDTGLLADIGNPGSVATALLELMAAPEFSRRLGLNGHALAVQEFDPGRNVARHAAIYREMAPSLR
jgi:glycosyltransferase involved in cell wall biosynthesis